MTNVLIGTGIYLIVGTLFIVALELLTGKVRKNMREATYDTQQKLVPLTGSLVRVQTAVVTTAILLWIFWPVALYGLIESHLRKER